MAKKIEKMCLRFFDIILSLKNEKNVEKKIFLVTNVEKIEPNIKKNKVILKIT